MCYRIFFITDPETVTSESGLFTDVLQRFVYLLLTLCSFFLRTLSPNESATIFNYFFKKYAYAHKHTYTNTLWFESIFFHIFSFTTLNNVAVTKMLQQAQFSTSNILNTDAYIEQNWEGKRKKKKKKWYWGFFRVPAWIKAKMVAILKEGLKQLGRGEIQEITFNSRACSTRRRMNKFSLVNLSLGFWTIELV